MQRTLVVHVKEGVVVAPAIPLKHLVAVVREALGLLRDAEHASLGLLGVRSRACLCGESRRL